MNNTNDQLIASTSPTVRLESLRQKLKQLISRIDCLEQEKVQVEAEIRKEESVLAQSEGEHIPVLDKKIIGEDADHSRTQETGEQTRATVLIVDDTRMMRLTLRKALRSGGYRVMEAENGSQALDMMWNKCTPVEAEDGTQTINAQGEESLDLAIIDIAMPDMDGLELVERIRSNTKTADLPVLICTISRRKNHIIRAAQLGVKGFLVKPVSPKLVLAKVNKILRR